MAEEMPSNFGSRMSRGNDTPESAAKEPTPPMVERANEASEELHRSELALLVTIPDPELSERLRMVVEEAAAGNAVSMEGLRLAVSEFTVALKKAGTTPEAVLITLKTVIHNRSVLGIVPHASDRKGQLREQVSTWCIDEYFREETG